MKLTFVTFPLSSYPTIEIVEVGPRDGLQNEAAILTSDQKVDLVESLAATGLKRIEFGSFVSSQRVPQMADSGDVFLRLRQRPSVRYSALVANQRGLETALELGVGEVAVFAAASETFSQKNINCSIAESISRFRHLVDEATQAGVRVRGYVSCVLGCPYEGYIKPEVVLPVVLSLLEAGCFEVSVGDTIGSGTPETTDSLLRTLIGPCAPESLAVHFHDTGGRALENIDAAIDFGIRVIDSSVGGLGGCPFAPGSPGNVATEQVVSTLHAKGYETGVDESKLAVLAKRVVDMLGKHRTCPTQTACEQST